MAFCAMEGLVSFFHVYVHANLSLLFLFCDDNIGDPGAVIVRVNIFNLVFFSEAL